MLHHRLHGLCAVSRPDSCLAGPTLPSWPADELGAHERLAKRTDFPRAIYCRVFPYDFWIHSAEFGVWISLWILGRSRHGRTLCDGGSVRRCARIATLLPEQHACPIWLGPPEGDHACCGGKAGISCRRPHETNSYSVRAAKWPVCREWTYHTY